MDCRKRTNSNDVAHRQIESDADESRRCSKDEVLRRERLSKIQEDAINFAKANAAVELCWAELLERGIPQEFRGEIDL